MTANQAPWRPHRSSPRGPGILLPLAVAAIQVIGTHFAGLRQPERVDLDTLGIFLLAIGPASLFFRRRYPAVVLGFVFATTLGYYLLGYPHGPIFIALIVAFVTAVMAGRRALAVAVLVIGYVSFLWLGPVFDVEDAPDWSAALGLGAWLLVLFSAAEFARTRREQAIEAARARAEQRRRRANEERLRIAQELHDVLAHNISLINVQAGVALHLIDERPEQARTALGAIKDASNQALGELRSVLDVLRRDDEAPPRGPASGLARLDDLVAKTKAAGLQVTKRVEGTPRHLPAEVDLAAFRIVQEALTNVTRHAGEAHATISIGYGERDLTVRIDDDGRGASAPAVDGAGRGIAGMRERATALGGDLEAGPRPEGGFRVTARLPADENAAREDA